MLSPIRPLQSTEVRRVDEITPRKYVAAPVSSPFDETNEGVRLSIGDDARRLAYSQRESTGRRQSPAEAPASASGLDTAPSVEPASTEPAKPVLQGVALPFAFQNEATDEDFGPQPAGPNAFANRALRAFTSSRSAPQGNAVRDSAFPEDEGERPWASEESSRVPFEVFQRAVTDATAGASGTQTRSSFSPLKQIFSPPENGGEPYGRAVPFEDEQSLEMPFGTGSGQPQSGVMPKLSQEAVDELIADSSWSLPERYSVRPTGTAAA
jgi:hypothetical protein